MGDMTVANPTTGIASAAPIDAVPGDRRRPSRASTRSLQFGGLVVVVDMVLAAASIAVLYFIASPAQLDAMALAFDGAKFATVGSLAVVAVVSGIRGLHETADRRLTRRHWAVAGIGIGGFFGLLVASSFVATAVMTLAR